MSTPAVYTFKGDQSKSQPDIHLVYGCDGYPRSVDTNVPALLRVAQAIWAGEEVDLSRVQFGNFESDVTRRNSLEESKPPTHFRYQIEVVDGRPVAITALRHEAVIPEDLTTRLEAARKALEAVEAEMQAARDVPTYVEIGKGDLRTIKKLGFGQD